MSATEKLDIDTLTGRELDAAVAVEVMGWVYDPSEAIVIGPHYAAPNGETHYICKAYSTDANAAREVEAEIERRGLVDRYVKIMVDDIEPPLGLSKHFVNGLTWIGLFKLITATPEQRCRAAYRAVMG